MITAFLLTICETSRIQGVGQALADAPGVSEVYTTTGTVDFIAIVRVPDLEALAALVTEHIATIPGISRTDTHLAIRSYGRSDEAAAFDIGVS